MKTLTTMAALAVFALLAFGSTDDDSDKDAPAVGTAERLEHELRQAVGDDLVDWRLSDNGYVLFDISENLSNNMTIGGAALDTKKILSGVKQSGVDYNHFQIEGRYPMSNQYGEVSKDIVITLYYEKGTVDRAQWENVTNDSVFDLTETKRIHPAFRR